MSSLPWRIALNSGWLVVAIACGSDDDRSASTDPPADGGADSSPQMGVDAAADAAVDAEAGTPTCVTLQETPLLDSQMQWTGLPLCEPSGVCLESPIPAYGIHEISTPVGGSNWALAYDTVLRWQGQQGQVYRVGALDESIFPANYTGLFARSDDDVWLAGGNSSLAHFDGTSWSLSELTVGSALADLWASAANDVWTVGNFGVIGHFDGTTWTASSKAGYNFNAVFGLASNDVWTVGSIDLDDGAAQHWNGTEWTAVPVDASSWLEDVWAAAADDVWMVGRDGVVLHGSVAGFASVALPGSTPDTLFDGVWGSSASDVWITGGNAAYHYDGTTWTKLAGQVSRIRGRSAADLTALTSTAMESWQGDVHTPRFPLGGPNLNAAWAAGPDELWFAGEGGTVVHRRGSTLARASVGEQNLVSVWGSSPSDVWLLDDKAQIWRGNGTTFCPLVQLAHDQVLGSFSELGGSGPNDVWVVRAQGSSMHFDGSTFQEVDVAASHVLALAPNDVWATGNAIWHWNGTEWSNPPGAPVPVEDASFGTLWASSPTNVWTSRSERFGDRNFVHWNGTALTLGEESDEDVQLAGSAPDDVWSFGSDTRHYDGTTWTRVPGRDFPGVAAAGSASGVWLVGRNGLVAHHPH